MIKVAEVAGLAVIFAAWFFVFGPFNMCLETWQHGKAKVAHEVTLQEQEKTRQAELALEKSKVDHDTRQPS